MNKYNEEKWKGNQVQVRENEKERSTWKKKQKQNVYM